MKNTYNICIGYEAGRFITSGHHIICLGDYSGKKLTGQSYVLYINTMEMYEIQIHFPFFFRWVWWMFYKQLIGQFK